jgi:Rod binding domain-containing protein
MNSILPPYGGRSSSPEKTEQQARVYKAAQDFEALLLASILGPLEKSFSSLSKQESGGDDYHYMGVQALAGALSKSGGIGVAELLARQLLRTEVSAGAGTDSGRVRTLLSGQ